MRLRGKLLKKNTEFARVYRYGQSFPGRYCVLFYLPDQDRWARAGISVSKKVGNSVTRHRIKRLYKEAFRLNYASIKPGCHLVIVARKRAALLSFSLCQADFLAVLGRAGILKPTGRGGSE